MAAAQRPETRFLVFTTIAYGGRGISYFIYWGPEAYRGLYQDGKPSPMVKEVAALNAEIAKFGPALMDWIPRQSITPPLTLWNPGGSRRRPCAVHRRR